MGNILIRSVIFLMVADASHEQQCTNETIINTIARKGSSHVLNCTGKPILWRGNCNASGHCEDIHDGIKMMLSMIDKVAVDNETNDIIIINVTFGDAGVYHCHPYKLSVCFTYNVIVVDGDISCIPSLSESAETCNISCSFRYRTNHDCQVAPLWLNSKINAHLLSLNKKTGYDDGYIWLSLNKDDLQDVEDLHLITLFTCKRNDLIKEVLYNTNFTLTNFCHFKKSLPDAFLIAGLAGSAFLVILAIGIPVVIYIIRRSHQNLQPIRNQKLPDPPDIFEYETIPDIQLATYKVPRDCVIPTISKKSKYFAKSGYLKKSLSQGDGSSHDLFRDKSDHVHSVCLSCNNLPGRSTIPNAHITEIPVYKVPQNGDTIKYSQHFLKSHSNIKNEDQNVNSSIDKPESSAYYELESLELKATHVGICSA